MADLKAVSEALMKGDRDGVKNGVQAAVDEGLDVGTILSEGLIAGMGVIGEKFRKNEVYVPEVLIAARAMHAGLDILKPLLAESGVQPVAKVVLGTVKGDLHDIGKNLVSMMLQGGGFEVIDLGTDVPADKFVDAAKENQAHIIAMSALLTTTMPQMKDVVAAANAAGLFEVKTIIGGAPVTQAYAEEIGASGYAPDAASAVLSCKELAEAN